MTICRHIDKSLLRLLLAVPLPLSVLSCRELAGERETRFYDGDIPRDAIPGTAFEKVEESTLTFNAAFTGRPVTGAEGLFQDIEPEFVISRRPVTPSQYKAVCGKVPSGGISHDDAERFLDRLYKQTGIPFVLPTEAMYEAAVHQGAINPPKGEKVYVSDNWNGEPLPDRLAVEWKRTSDGGQTVLRSLYERTPVQPYQRTGGCSFYVAVRTGTPISQALMDRLDPSKEPGREPFVKGDESFNVNSVSFRMKAVEGGRCLLGATREQERYAEEDEYPVRDTVLSPFKISETEVTAALWQAIMGYLPDGNDARHPNRPVVGVSWYDAQEFITALNDITNRRFRLPGEWEWEYAARGGTKTHGYLFSGSNRAQEVAVCSRRARDDSDEFHPGPTDVATLRPNELGLYDLSGNAWEWVRGMHPSGNAVLRGGSRMSLNAACRVSNRQATEPGHSKNTFGFRLAL